MVMPPWYHNKGEPVTEKAKHTDKEDKSNFTKGKKDYPNVEDVKKRKPKETPKIKEAKASAGGRGRH
jgi:hypothetical protein